MQQRKLIAGSAVLVALVTAAVIAALGPQHARRTTRHAARGRSPTCVPTQLNRSASLPGTSLAVSPLPGSLDASPQTQISLLGLAGRELRHISITGSSTGSHTGRLRSYSQADGASYLPDRPFAAGESVMVQGETTQTGLPRRFSFQFTVAERDAIPTVPGAAPPTPKPGDVQSFHSRPDLRPPSVSVTVRSPLAAPGYVLAAPYAGSAQSGPMIFDGSGQLVWFDRLPYNTEATNLNVQRYRGKPALTWWQGYIPPQGFGEGEDIIANRAYQPIRRVRAGNGYLADLHDFQIGPRNTALMTVFNVIRCDLSNAGGPRAAALTDGVYQEVDLQTGLVRREWHSVDHVRLDDSYAGPSDASLQWPFDGFHINTVNPNPDGSVLVSGRSTWAFYRVDARTGQILATVGGRHPSVTMGPGTTTAWQHDARVRSDGTISVFDNEAGPAIQPQSRGILERLDPYSNSVTLLRQYTHPSPLSSTSQGNMQTLADGHVFLGWGSQPYFSEYAPDGKLLFDAQMPPPTASFRGFRFVWGGAPAQPPAVATSSGAKGRLAVYASWNGATAVTSWRVLGGPRPGHLKPVAEAARAGFETAIPISGAPPYVQVLALNRRKRILGTSLAVRVAR